MGGFRLPDLSIPDKEPTSYNLTNSGTFQEGDLAIGRAGLIIGRNGHPPQRTGRYQPSSALPTIAGSPLPYNGLHDASLPVSPEQPAAPSLPEETEEDAVLRGLALEDLEDHGLVGSGASGLVRKVVYPPMGRTLVLKVIQFDFSNETVRKHITGELRTLYESHHAYIVRYYQAYLEEGCIIVVMEFMDAGTLTQLMARAARPIPEPHLAVLARQALQGLDYLHREMRVIHRDIKPSNLLLGSQGVIKISDFGVSGQLGSSVSQAASWVGTVTYMSPERIQGASYGFPTDIWALGLTLLEAALGRFPYLSDATQDGGSTAGPGFWDLLGQIVHKPSPVPAPGGSMSPQLCDFLSQALAKDPRQRPSAAQLLAHPFLETRGTDGRYADLAQYIREVSQKPEPSPSVGGR